MNEEEYVRKSLKEHEEIIEYIRSGNEVECYLKMHAHIDESCKTLHLQYAYIVKVHKNKTLIFRKTSKLLNLIDSGGVFVYSHIVYKIKCKK